MKCMRSSRVRNALAAIAAAILLSACVSLPADFQQPQVTVRSVALRVVNGLSVDFDIVLNVTNPNRKALSAKGLRYTIRLLGRQVVEGVANDIPTIAAYGEADVNLSATADLITGLALLNDLLARPNEPLDYEFNAEIDLGALYPMLEVQRSGVIDLGAN